MSNRPYKHGYTQADVDRIIDEIMPVDSEPKHAPPASTTDEASLVDENDPTCAPSPELEPAALHGIVGEIVRTIAPHTEGHPAGILFSLLTMIGCLIGRGPHQQIDGARHGLNLFTLLIGPTGDGRKGTALARAREIVRAVDPDFERHNFACGLSSGQGVIYHIRDATPAPPSSDGKPSKPADPGIMDKRIFISEDEMASALRQMAGRECTLSPTLRTAWDGQTLRTLTRSNALTATDPHVSLVGQITPEELLSTLKDVDYNGGFLNRFLFAYVERVQVLPFGGEAPQAVLNPLLEQLKRAVDFAQGVGKMELNAAGRECWATMYPGLTLGVPGRVGAATRRGAPQVRRLAMLLALLDQGTQIGAQHLDAAAAIWRYSVGSARRVFGTARPSQLAAKYDRALEEAGSDGLDLLELREVGGSHAIPASERRAALNELRQAGRARMALDRSTGGRPREVWRHIKHALARNSEPTANLVGTIGVTGANGAGVESVRDLAPITPLTPNANAEEQARAAIHPTPESRSAISMVAGT